jgi:hypothetical protein
MNTDKKVVSPFEFAIVQIADPDKAHTMRAETKEESRKRIEDKMKDFLSKIKTKDGEAATIG